MTKTIEELLPFYVNGSLDETDIAQVKKAMQDNPSLEKDITFLEVLRDEVKAQEVENSPGELGLKRLQKAIAAEKLKIDPIAYAKHKIPKEQNYFWKGLTSAACLLLMLQTVLMFRQQDIGDLVAAGGPSVVQTTGHIIEVTFVPTAQEENIRDLLLRMDAVIVDGPSALGIYKISVRNAPDTALEELNADKELVESATFDQSGMPDK